MIEKHELLKARIFQAVKNEPLRYGLGDYLACENESNARHKLLSYKSGRKINLQAGAGIRGTNYPSGSDLSPGEEMTVWVTDLSVIPPVTRFVIDTILGPQAGQMAHDFDNPATNAVPAEMVSAGSEKGEQIIKAMQRLLDQVVIQYIGT